MTLPLQFVGAFILTYATSRIAVRLPLPYQGLRRLWLAHAISFALASALIIIVRAPHGHFKLIELSPLVAMELFWVLVDRARHNLPSWE